MLGAKNFQVGGQGAAVERRVHPPAPASLHGRRRRRSKATDTVWVEGIKYRLADIDTPEKGALAQCMQEGLQAIEATKRLAEILTDHPFRIDRTGKRDRYGRVLALFRVGKTTAGGMLVAEGLARPWRGRTERWCE